MEWFGDPASIELKLLGFLLCAVTSTLFKLGTHNLREVWLMERDLAVVVDGQRLMVPLEEIVEIKGSRGQKVKTIRLLLRGSSRAGKEIRFIPVARAQLPFSDHPVVKEIRRNMHQITEGASADGALLPWETPPWQAPPGVATGRNQGVPSVPSTSSLPSSTYSDVKTDTHPTGSLEV